MKLYRHDCPYGYCPSRWSKFGDNDEEQAALEQCVSNEPIVHRHSLDDKKWITESFTVHSPAMRAHLRMALAKYQDFDLDLEDWTFKPPYKPIVHRWDRLNALAENLGDPDSKNAIDQLLAFLQPILAPAVKALAQTKETGKIVFDDVWQIFPPGELAVTTFFAVESVCRVEKYEKVEPLGQLPYWVISLEYIDWNGEHCGYTTTKVVIKSFKGPRHVISLPVHPLCFRDTAADIRSGMVERGRKFERLRGYHFRTCVGTMILLETKQAEERPVAGRVIIDSYAYYHTKNMVKPDLRPLASAREDAAKAPASSDDEEIVDTSDSDVPDGPEMTARKLNMAMARQEFFEDLTDDECLLATPWVRGLNLKTKQWARFLVDDLSPIIWNDAAFDHLVHPGNAKELAWSFVENKALAANTFDDFVQDKGRGLIILMFGPPGVGKTYTAEAVAERSRVPLYSMSAGTLGTKPKFVEAALDRALDLCKLWNAMLLLDEADVFLGARTTTDLARNELVAVFLTKLEYYQGICFLTTNRMSSIDHAFQSRVDLFLPYQDLTAATRRRVWEGFIDRAGRDKFAVSAADLDKLAEVKLNGREIKNLVKSANLLSLKSGDKIGMARLTMLANNRIEALDALDGM
ncbi:P-loop containing nucleoside triphosphate hydrolase protein [Pleurostoma richardsiae]|uniref:P-loop containing nucleoside triphosphate hydrolase protein n=1 Tax=Pleurostoma richardsiae TaxID=41990 RepID=A0AA38RQG1_9PEZI|nr:P-loop containing nucleoside triphosphate hydrolase protein [Pleurostoma richardsiae]